MPYKCEKLHIPKEKDKRRKLTEEDKSEIKKHYGKISQRKLAKIFCVSRRLIQFIGDPTKKERDLLLRKLRGGSAAYYNKNKHKDYMKKHRRRKQKLFLQGELNE